MLAVPEKIDHQKTTPHNQPTPKQASKKALVDETKQYFYIIYVNKLYMNHT
jgi:hypothetical protein